MEERISASTPASAPAEDLSLPEENDPFQGVFLSLDQLADAQTLADGYDGVILPMKTADGALGYVSALPLAADAGASSGDPDRNEVLRALNDTPGLYTVAQVSCLRDSALVREEPAVTLSVMGQRDSVTADPVSGQTTALLATFGRVWTQAEDQEALAAFDPVVLPAVS